MRQQTRLFRKPLYRMAKPRVAWGRVRPAQARRALRALEALYREYC